MLDAITNRSAASATAAKPAAANAVQGSSFQSALASTAEKVVEPQDTLQLSGMSDWEKLAELKRLHARTDYSGMSVGERIRLIEDRWSCLPIHAMNSDLYGPVCVMGDTGEPTRKYFFRDHAVVEYRKQYEDAGIKYKPGQYREAMYGGMSDQEVLTALSKKYSGGTIIDRAGMLFELGAMRMDGNDGKICFGAIQAMRYMFLRQTGGASEFDLSAGSPWQESKIEQLARDTKVSWGSVAQMLKDYASQNGEEASLDWLLEALGKHTDSMAEQDSIRRQLQLKQLREDQAQEDQVQEDQVREDQMLEALERKESA